MHAGQTIGVVVVSEVSGSPSVVVEVSLEAGSQAILGQAFPAMHSQHYIASTPV